MSDKKKKDDEIKVRDWLAVEVHHKSGAGTHGGGKKRRNRKDRRKGNLKIRKGEYDE